MLAFFGLGTQEIILLAIFGGGIAATVLIVFLTVSARNATRTGGPTPHVDERIADLEEENRRLRAELDAARGKSGGPA